METIVPIENQLRIVPELMFEADGNITRWIVATIDAFSFEDKLDYPDIQVWRAFEENSSEFTLVHSTSGLSPSLTDDTNLYEYVLDEPWPVRAGDFIGMYVPDKEMARLFIYSTERSDGPTNYYFLNAQSTQQTFDTSLNPFTSTNIPLVFADFIQGIQILCNMFWLLIFLTQLHAACSREYYGISTKVDVLLLKIRTK